MALSVDAFKTPNGYLKILHVILGAICLGIVGYYYTSSKLSVGIHVENEIFFYLLVTYACLFTSFLLLISFLHEDSAEKLKKSSFEILYHLFSFIFYLAATISFIVIIAKVPKEGRKGGPYVAHIIAVICSSANSLLYAANAFVAFKSE